MSGAGVDPGERARILLLRGDELLAAGTPESLDEAMLAYQGGLEVAREPGVEDADLPRAFEERIAVVRRRLLEPGSEEEDEPDNDGAAERDERSESADVRAGEPSEGDDRADEAEPESG